MFISLNIASCEAEWPLSFGNIRVFFVYPIADATPLRYETDVGWGPVADRQFLSRTQRQLLPYARIHRGHTQCVSLLPSRSRSASWPPRPCRRSLLRSPATALSTPTSRPPRRRSRSRRRSRLRRRKRRSPA